MERQPFALVDGGTVNATPVAGIDFYKTFASMSGAGDPAGVTLDGGDLTGVFADATADLGREALYWHLPGYLIDGSRNQRPQSVIRSGEWKLFYNYEDPELRTLRPGRADISELNNVAAAESPDGWPTGAATHAVGSRRPTRRWPRSDPARST